MEYLLEALALGFAAGVSPGPLMTLVIATALERGVGGGLKVAVAPLLTDAPILGLGLLAVGQMPAGALPWLNVAGGAFVLWVGVTSLRASRTASLEVEGEAPPRRDLLRGAVVNVLNPHPWIFWLTVGAPLLVGAWRSGPGWAVGFLAVFFGLLVGLKALVAVLVAGGRRFLSDRTYRLVLGLSALVLLGLGAVLVRRGIAGIAG